MILVLLASLAIAMSSSLAPAAPLPETIKSPENFQPNSRGNAKAKYDKREPMGALCVGRDYSKSMPEKDIYIKVDDRDKKAYSAMAGTIVYDQLDLNKKYSVQVLKGDEAMESFELDFKKFNSNFAIIWKSPGQWRLRPLKGEICDVP